MNKADLINAINEFDGYDDTTFGNLRDVICELSDKHVYENDPSLKELLYIAAQKMRVFGYNKMNGFNADTLVNNASFGIGEIVDEYYMSGSGYKLDYEQKKALETYGQATQKRLFLSAPTAFGKTFILQEIILRNTYNTILLIFPTVSLLNENTKSINDFIGRNNLDYTVINTTRELGKELDKKILILTPERVLKLFLTLPPSTIDFFFMDEIYKVDNFFDTSEADETSEDDRDKVFRIVLYILAKSVRDFYLAGPYINTDNMGAGFSAFIDRHDVMVYKVDKEMISKRQYAAWASRLKLDTTVSYKLPQKQLEKLTTLLGIIQENKLGRTLVYMATKSQIDKASSHLLAGSSNRGKKDVRLRRFLRHLRTRYSFVDEGVEVSQHWSLPRMLEYGYGVHHGALPKYIQEEVLQLFNDKLLDVMISTTSITEGINIDANNVIFYGATKGGKELKVFDVKNINGRAGRYYHNFVGRIFYMNKEVKKILDDRRDEPLDFATYSNKDLDKVDIDNADPEDLSEKNARLKNEREEEIARSGIPDGILKKNRLIDKLKQIEMIHRLEKENTAFFAQKANTYSSIRTFLSSGELKNILSFFYKVGVIEDYEVEIYSAISANYSKFGFAGLLSYEIKKQREKNKGQQLSDEKYDTCYRSAFTKIRNTVEFEIPKLLSTYAHIFSFVCNRRGVSFDETTFDSIITFYELGVHTEVGIILAEKGFPIGAIKQLEQHNSSIMSNLNSFKNSALPESGNALLTGLDEYEKWLLRKYLA